MSQQPMSRHVTPSAFKQLLLALSLVTLIAMLLSCEPSAAPPISSPLQTPIPTSLSDAISKKLTPSVVVIYTPGPNVFGAIQESTPAGTGAIAHVVPPFFTHDFLVENSWYKDTMNGTIRTFVHTGNVSSPGGFATQQGVVVVQVLKMDAHGTVSMVYYKQFLTPTQSGPVHITGAVGQRLILQSTNGATFYFDAPARQFVPSLTWVSPIATPNPQPVTPSP
jgi:hypothetical protein